MGSDTRALVFALIVFTTMSPNTGVAHTLRGAPFPGTRQVTPARPLTLKQAWRVALGAARSRWSNQAMMVELGTFDAGGDTITSGRNGRRRAWMATIVAPNKPAAQFIERIIDGVVVEVRSLDQPIPAIEAPMRRLPRIDSDVAVRVAVRTRPDVRPDQTREHGYGFIAHVDVQGRVVIAVMGNYRDHPAQVDVGAGSGRVLGSLIYTFRSTVLYSKNAGQRWGKSTLHCGFVAGIAAVPSSPRLGYAVECGIRSTRIWKTRDGGRSWTMASILPQGAGTNAHGLVMARLPNHGTVMAVGTATGLWSSVDRGTSWIQALASRREWPSGWRRDG